MFVTLQFKDRDFTENTIYEKLLNDKLSTNLGYLYENAVAQILIANGHDLFYYTFKNLEQKRNYEIDFIIPKKNKICPIEVKSSNYKKHTSIDEFYKKYSSCGIEPFSNGVVIANREYAGMTPLGMTFPEMASMTGGGVQTPGFMGHGKHFIGSKKFMKAEGGIERIVWMPKELKEFVADRLNETAKELYGIENFTDMIGDETIATDPEELVGFLTEKGHPALSMEPMM